MTKKIEDIITSGSDLINKQEYDNAESLFREGLTINPNSAVCYNNLGMIKLLKKEVEEAIPLFEKAIELDPKILEAYQNLGSSYLYQEEIDKAESMYLRALQIDPNNFNTYHNLSTLYIKTEQASKAKKSLEKLIQLDENNIDASFMLGTIYLSLKEYYPAIANFFYTLSLNDNFPNARMGLAEAFYRLGRYKMALKELDLLIKALPDLVTPYIKSSLILIETGQHPLAIPLLEKAISMDRQNLEIIEILAILFEESGNKERAEELYQEILILDPEHKNASEGLERLEKLSVNPNDSSANPFS